jgi:hypothetical protein
MAASPKRRPGGVVNWDKPPVKDAVERAYEDGITDPAAIAKWAKDEFDLDVTPEEVVAILAARKPGE